MLWRINPSAMFPVESPFWPFKEGGSDLIKA